MRERENEVGNLLVASRKSVGRFFSSITASRSHHSSASVTDNTDHGRTYFARRSLNLWPDRAAEWSGVIYFQCCAPLMNVPGCGGDGGTSKSVNVFLLIFFTLSRWCGRRADGVRAGDECAGMSAAISYGQSDFSQTHKHTRAHAMADGRTTVRLVNTIQGATRRGRNLKIRIAWFIVAVLMALI